MEETKQESKVTKTVYKDIFKKAEGTRKKEHYRLVHIARQQIIFGVLAMIAALINFFGVYVAPIFGIVFGGLTFASVRKAKRNRVKYSVLGLILAIIGFSISMIFFLITTYVMIYG